MTDLVYDKRLYKYIKMTAIPNESMAFVEYIKNSYDSYVRGNLTNEEMYINIGVNAKDRYIYAIDRAEGMSSEELIKNFSQVGSHTGGSSEYVNALFSKGATDTTALGTVIYTTIKNNKISSCMITYNDVFSILVSDKDVTEEERIKYDIPKNGTHLVLNLLDTYTIRKYSDIRNIHKYFSLGTIVSHENTKLLFDFIDSDGDVIDDKTELILEPIDVQEVLIDNEKIEIPGWYEDDGSPVYSYFSLYLAKDEIDSINTDDNYKRSGCFISYNGVIIDRTMFHRSLETIPVSRRIFGTLKCDFIFKVMMRYDAGDTNTLNTLPLIEPSRLTGLNRHHPFTNSLMHVPREHTRFIIEDLDSKESSFNKESSIKIDDLFNILGEWHSAVIYEMKEFLYAYQKKSTISNYNTIIKMKDNVVSSGGESKYNFKEVNEIEPVDNGNINPSFPSIVLTFVNDDKNVYPYILYGINSRIQVNLNVTDYLLSKCVKYNETNNTFTITDSKELSLHIVHYLSEALSREIFKYADSKMNTGDVVERNSDSSFNKLFEFRPSLHMAIYTILITHNKLNDLISNES